MTNKNTITMDVIRDCSPTRPKLTKTSDRHPKSLLEQICSLRKSNELCDVVLIVGSSKINAHKIILSASSPYFRAMFTGELAESRQTEITIKDIDENAMEILIDFCYTSKITVDEKTVQTVLPAACLLQLQEVQDYCAEFLRSQLDPSNCLGIRSFAEIHSCRELLKIADKYMQNNFVDVAESDEFLLLPIEQLVEIVSNDELNVNNEEQVYQAVMNWIRHDINERKQYLSQLICHVRLPLLETKFLVTKVGNDPLIRQDQTCRDLIDEAKDYHLLPQERSLVQGPRTKPRKPFITGEVLFAVGGWCSGDAISSVEMYDPQTGNEWKTVSAMTKKRCGVGVGVLNQQIYAIGGHDGQSYLNTVERYDPVVNQWFSDVSPTATRTSVGVAVLENYLYAVGGQDGVSCLNIVEKYDSINNRWTRVSSMSTKRLGLALVAYGNYLFAIGGSDGQIPLNTVERYDPKTNKWSQVAPMLTRRKHLGCAVFKNYIYAVGGRDDVSELNSAERYNPSTNQWQPVVSMKSKRSGVGLAVVNGNLMAIGGFDGTTYLKTVEIYDSESNSWKVNNSMIFRRLGGGCGVIKLQKDSVLLKLPTQNLTPNTNNRINMNNTSTSNTVATTSSINNSQINTLTSNQNTQRLANYSTSSTNLNSNNTIHMNTTWPLLSPVPSLLANVPQNNVTSLISNSQSSSSNRNHISPTSVISTITSESILNDFNNLNINETGTYNATTINNQTSSNQDNSNNESNSELMTSMVNTSVRLVDI